MVEKNAAFLHVRQRNTELLVAVSVRVDLLSESQIFAV